MLRKKLSLTKKSIPELESDVLFNYTNTDFIPAHQGVFRSLMNADPGLARECAVGTLKPGTAIILGAASLPFKRICHFAISGIGNDPTEDSVRKAMRWGFQLMAEYRYPSYVLPALNEDGGGMPCGMCADLILREALIFADNNFVEKILVQTKDAKEYSAYMAALKKLLKK